MSEGHNFEVPPKSHEPQIIEIVLEKGEIESAKILEGYFPVKAIKIKDDGRALFKPSMGEFQEIRKKLLSGLIEIVDCSKVWKEVKLEQVIYFYDKNKNDNFYNFSFANDSILHIYFHKDSRSNVLDKKNSHR